MKNYISCFFIIIWGNLMLANPVTKCDRKQDSLELANFYLTHNGPNWKSFDWDLSEPMNSWPGLTLNAQGCVQKLILVKRMTGSVPDFQLPELEVLSLRGFFSSLKGNIPDFRGMPLLKELTISSQDSIVGPIPDFAYLPLLEKLEIRGTGVVGNIPNFQHLPKLRKLILRGGQGLYGEIPDFELPQLELLEIQQAGLSGAIPDFHYLPELEELNLRNSYKLSGAIPDFQYIPKLKRLNLGGGKFMGVVSLSSIEGPIPDFSHLPYLQELRIWYTRATDTVTNFSHLPQLEVLEVVGKFYSGKLPALNRLPKLKRVRIGGYRVILGFARHSNISGTLPNFSRLPDLESLDLSLNRITGSVPDFQLAKLKELLLNNNLLSGTIPAFSQLPAIKKVFLMVNRFDSLQAPKSSSIRLSVSYNYLTFEDILPHISRLISYEPQAEIPVSATIFINSQGKQEVDIHLDEQVAGSTYNWYLNDVLKASTTTNNWRLPANYKARDKIYVKITNPGAPELTLTTKILEILQK